MQPALVNAPSTPIVANDHGLPHGDESLSYSVLQSKLQKLETVYNAQHLELIDYKQKANYWHAQHKRAVEREAEQKKQHAKIVEKLEAKLRKLNKQLFGKKSEKTSGKSERTSTTSENANAAIAPGEAQQKKKRGQQPDNKGPSRRDYSHLPSSSETIGLCDSSQKCSCCGLPYEELPGVETSEIIELVEVRAHVRKVRRKVYKRNKACRCPEQPRIITAPVAPRLIPKTRFGVSVWRHLLLEKFHYQRPIERAIKVLANQNISLSPGTITGGFKKIMPLFFPIYNALQEQSLQNHHWHADETRWEVYEEIEGKASSRWYMWIFKAQDTVIFKVSPTRSAQVPRDFFKDTGNNSILSVDRYSAYKCIANEGLLILAFCWAHVRRDFLDYAKSHPSEDAWAMDWVEEIANLYHINNQRILFNPESAEFQLFDNKLRKAANEFQDKYKQQLLDENLVKEKKAILTSLDNHWKGLTVFIDYFFVPMDNNTAERGLRPAVLARKAFYGSRAVWSAMLLVLLMSIFQTLELWGVNVHRWLDVYLNACAENNGEVPSNINQFLPWNMSKRRLKEFQNPISYEDTS